MNISSIEYKKAFERYLRRGVPIDLSLKQERRTGHYIWRTRRDDRVRPSHAANEGKIFAWDRPPPTGHPGEDYGCRCTAENYNPDVSEYMNITLSGVSDSGPSWSINDLRNYYYNGGGDPVTLRQIGLLEDIVNEYMRQVEKRLKGQIAETARRVAGKRFFNTFGRPYPLHLAVVSIGWATVKGDYSGNSRLDLDGLHLAGKINFEFYDKYTDTFDVINIVPGEWDPEDATPFEITDKWNGTCEGIIHPDRSRSKFFSDDI